MELHSGHEAYKDWLANVGPCFSPLSRSKERLVAGKWSSWTVDGLYQGLKRLWIGDLSLVDSFMEPQVVDADLTGYIIHLPAIMRVEEKLQLHPLFHALKSGKNYNSKRNRYFGRTPEGQRNRAFTDTWLHPETGEILTRLEFSETVTAPALKAHLIQFPEEIGELRAAWANVEYLITDAMKQAHGTLCLVEELVRSATAWPPRCRCSRTDQRRPRSVNA